MNKHIFFDFGDASIYSIAGCSKAVAPVPGTDYGETRKQCEQAKGTWLKLQGMHRTL